MGRGRTLTEQDEDFIINNWNTMTNIAISKALGIHRDTVSTKGSKLGLSSKRSNELSRKNYTSRQIQNYKPSPETILEAKGRQETLELKRIAEEIKGKGKLRIKFKTGETNSKSRILDGVVIQQNDVLVALKLGNYVESFKYIEFYTGRVVIMQ